MLSYAQNEHIPIETHCHRRKPCSCKLCTTTDHVGMNYCTHPFQIDVLTFTDLLSCFWCMNYCLLYCISPF